MSQKTEAIPTKTRNTRKSLNLPESLNFRKDFFILDGLPAIQAVLTLLFSHLAGSFLKIGAALFHHLVVLNLTGFFRLLLLLRVGIGEN